MNRPLCELHSSLQGTRGAHAARLANAARRVQQRQARSAPGAQPAARGSPPWASPLFLRQQPTCYCCCCAHDQPRGPGGVTRPAKSVVASDLRGVRRCPAPLLPAVAELTAEHVRCPGRAPARSHVTPALLCATERRARRCCCCCLHKNLCCWLAAGFGSCSLRPTQTVNARWCKCGALVQFIVAVVAPAAAGVCRASRPMCHRARRSI